jgi:hypothetical protein
VCDEVLVSMSTDEATTFRTEYWLSRDEKVALWGEGPWLDEPDTFEWNFESVRCFALRHYELGNWMGYVGLQPGHPWYRRAFRDLESDVLTHGGLTFSSEEQPGRSIDGPERRPSPTNEPLWWLGFDCAHGGDALPITMRLFRTGSRAYGTYRHFRYVRDETERLAQQAIDIIRQMS